MYLYVKAGVGGTKKKAEQVEVVLVPSPAEYSTLASFHVPLGAFAEADFSPVIMTLSKDLPPPPPPAVSPADEVYTCYCS